MSAKEVMKKLKKLKGKVLQIKGNHSQWVIKK